MAVGRRERIVARLIVHFGKGFAGESGVLSLHGREVARCVALRSQNGAARSMEVDRPPATLEAVLEVPDRGLQTRLPLPEGHELHIVVDIEHSGLRARIVAEAPRIGWAEAG